MRKMRRRKFGIPFFILLSLASITVIYLLIQPMLGKSGSQPTITGNAGLEPETSTVTETETPTPTPEPTPVEPQFAEAVWMGVGDIMSHSPQLPGAYDAERGVYDFTPFF